MRHNDLHKRLALVSVACGAIHGVAHSINYAMQDGGSERERTALVDASGFALLTALVFAWCEASVRPRRYGAGFALPHAAGIGLTVMFFTAHSPTPFLFVCLLPALTIHIAERVLARTKRSTHHITSLRLSEPHGRFVTMHISGTSLPVLNGGETIAMRVPASEGGWLRQQDWHTFSLVSSPHGFILIVAVRGGFTSRLAMLARSSPGLTRNPLEVVVERPSPSEFTRAAIACRATGERAIGIASGIGITPFLSLLMSNTLSHLCWSIRCDEFADLASGGVVMERLETCARQFHDSFSVVVYVTGETMERLLSTDHRHYPHVEVRWGRRASWDEVIPSSTERTTRVLICGSKSFTQSVNTHIAQVNAANGRCVYRPISECG